MIYRFGEYHLDTVKIEFNRDGEALDIEPQVFSLLQHLVENRDRVVSKDELIGAVWDGRAISDTTLSSRIFSLRRAIGDTGQAQTLIRTIPRRGFRFVGEVTVNAAPSESAGADPLWPLSDVMHCKATVMLTLAVLPFKKSSNGLDEYFCEGLTEDIIFNLTPFSEIRVIAGGSSFQFKDRSLSVPEIAKRLQADFIVDGSVRRDGERLRIAVQLVEAASGVSIWADRYDREMSDLFAVQDAVTHMIVASLGVKIQNAALTRSLEKSPSNLDAYDCLLRARRYTATLNEEMHAEARDLLEKAISIDPNYADAYALLANVYLAEYRFDANPRPDPVNRALTMALTATRLDPENAYAHCWLAIVHFFQKDNAKFEAEAKRALDLNPNDPEILADIGHFLAYMGEFDRGTELSRRAQALNPLHPGWYHFASARYHYHEGAYEEMLVDIARISMPDFYWTHLLNAAALGQLGREEAARSLEQMNKLKPDISVAAEMHKWNLAPDDFDHIMEGLRKAGHPE
jgi:TolB-like protein/tetratricopeptide (TPR) repeat protein